MIVEETPNDTNSENIFKSYKEILAINGLSLNETSDST